MKNRIDSFYDYSVESSAEQELLHANAVAIANELNNLKQALSLSPKEFPILQNREGSSLEEENQELINYLSSVDALLMKENQISAAEIFTEFHSALETGVLLKDLKVKISDVTSLSVQLKYQKTKLAELLINAETKTIQIYTSEHANIDIENLSDLKKQLEKDISLLKARNKASENNYKNFLNIKDIKDVSDLLKENSAFLIFKKDSNPHFDLYNKYDQRIDLYYFNKESNTFTSTSGFSSSDYNKFIRYILDRITILDNRTPSQILIDEASVKIIEINNNPSFQTLLKSNNLTLSLTPRFDEDDDDYIFFDLTSENKMIIGSFGVLTSSGDVYIIDRNGYPIAAVNSIQDINLSGSEEEKKKTELPSEIPVISSFLDSEDSISFVLIGSHEKDADAIIIVHADKVKKSINLISLPRDLYYKEHKINNILKVFGPQKFSEELSKITGLNIKKYIQIDMYAFIDAVNIVGGIDIYLNKAVIDPSMKTEDNGVIGTLNYGKGDHHLNGKQALRLARSRHYSSDFARSRRQQKIIVSLKNAFDGKVTVSTIYNLVNTLIKNIDTNFSVLEIVSLLSNFKSAEISKQEVINNSNILYSTFTEIYKAEKNNIEFTEDSYKGAWILLPINNDWNVIRYYIRKIIGEV